MAFVVWCSGFFTLDREALESYELGSGQVHEDGTGGGELGSGADPKSAEAVAEVGRVKEDLVKIQEMLLLFSERLAQLEGGGGGQLDDDDAAASGPGGGAHKSRKGKASKGSSGSGGGGGGGGGGKRRRKDEG